MALVTSTEVNEILENPAGLSVTNFITTAHALVTAVFSGVTINSDLLKEIERYLAAHFFTITKRRAADEKIDDSSRKYSIGELGMGLKWTEYGQQALDMDITGTLAQLAAGKPRALFNVIDLIDA